MYNISVLFTAVVIWIAFRFREEKEGRWILLIAFLVGCSAGVHLLSLLAIPATALIMFYEPNSALKNGAVAIGSLFLTLAVYYFIVPSPLVIAEPFEMALVNNSDLPFFSGVLIVYVGLMMITLSMSYVVRSKPIFSVAFLSIFFLLIGSGAYTLAALRSSAGTPMNEGQPDDAFALQDYFARLQYGQAPLIYGPHFNAPVKEVDGEKVYKDGEPQVFGFEGEGYLTVSENVGREPFYDPEYCTVFQGCGVRLLSPSELTRNGVEYLKTLKVLQPSCKTSDISSGTNVATISCGTSFGISLEDRTILVVKVVWLMGTG